MRRRYEGKIKELNFENGDIVEAGDTILTLDVGSAESQKEALTTNIEEYKEKIKYNFAIQLTNTLHKSPLLIPVQ